MNALVSYTGTKVSAYRDRGEIQRGEIQISFDAAATWKTAVVWYQGQFAQQPQRTNPDLGDYRSAIPLFIV